MYIYVWLNMVADFSESQNVYIQMFIGKLGGLSAFVSGFQFATGFNLKAWAPPPLWYPQPFPSPRPSRTLCGRGGCQRGWGFKKHSFGHKLMLHRPGEQSLSSWSLFTSYIAPVAMAAGEPWNLLSSKPGHFHPPRYAAPFQRQNMWTSTLFNLLNDSRPS